MYLKTCAGLLTAVVLLAIGCSQSPVAPSQTPTAQTLTSMAGGAATSSAVQSRDLPFSGVVTGEADFSTNPKNCGFGFTTVTTAKGPATHMGLTTWHSEHCLAGEGNQIVDGDLVLTAANGDQVHTTYAGGCAGSGVIGELVLCSGSAAFSGGTGRFEHASGTAAWTGAIVFEGFTDPSWPGRWEWKGTITY